MGYPDEKAQIRHDYHHKKRKSKIMQIYQDMRNIKSKSSYISYIPENEPVPYLTLGSKREAPMTATH
jgi:hypothetical protein